MPPPSFPAPSRQFFWINIFGSPRPISLLEFLLILSISALSALPFFSKTLFSHRCPMISDFLYDTTMLISPLSNVSHFIRSQTRLSSLHLSSLNSSILYPLFQGRSHGFASVRKESVAISDFLCICRISSYVEVLCPF
jgi:hypothetical protein